MYYTINQLPKKDGDDGQLPPTNDNQITIARGDSPLILSPLIHENGFSPESFPSEEKNIKIIVANNSQAFIQNKIAGHTIVDDRDLELGLYDEGKTSRSISNASSINSTSKLIEMQEMKHVPSKYIDFITAFDYFVNNGKEELNEIKKNIKYTQKDELSTISETYCFCLTKKKRVRFEILENDQLEELRNYLTLMTVPFKNSNSIHIDICKEIYHAVLGKEINFDEKDSSNASHEEISIIDDKKEPKSPITKEWETLGFLGPNLEEEFRGFGIFGALMLLYFCTYHQELSGKLYQLSKDDKKHFPFVISVLHLLKIAMDLIKNKRFNKYINENQSVIFTIQAVHADVCKEFLKLWTNKSYTELDFHHIIESHIFEIVKKDSLAKQLLSSPKPRGKTVTTRSPAHTSPSSPSTIPHQQLSTTLKNRSHFK